MDAEAIIVAGGRASRMGKLTEKIPKALLPFGSSNLLYLHLQSFRANGVKQVTILAGHLSEVIREELRRIPTADMSVKIVVEPAPSGSGGCLRYFSKSPRSLLVVFADIMAWMDYSALVKQHQKRGSSITAVVHPNDHPADSDLVEMDDSGWITALHKKPRPKSLLCHNLAMAGIFVFEPEMLRGIPETGSHDLVQGILGPKIAGGCRVLAYQTTEYLKDCGTPERYARVRNDFDSGKVHAHHRSTPRPAFFIDRDGTINRHVGYVTRPDQLELLPGVASAIRRLNEAGMLAILVTNQPVVARGECSTAELDRIHAQLETLLGAEGAYLDRIYTCPHHPDSGFPGEVAHLKIKCKCRKPSPGMVQRAAKELPIDLGRSAVVGDSDCDVSMARHLNLHAYYITEGRPIAPGITSVRDLGEAVSDWLSACGMFGKSTDY